MFKVLSCVTSHHNLPLVLTAAVVCLLATSAVVFLYSRVPGFPTWRRWTGLALTGLVAGSGIWTTHFVAMLAFETGMPVGYDLSPTLISLLVAAVGTTMGFAVASAPKGPGRPPAPMALGGLIVGLSITAMHYIGMDGYRTAGVVHWDAAYVVASVLIGAGLSSAAMTLARPGSGLPRQASAVGLLTLAIVGMHFTGMTAVSIAPDASVRVLASALSTPLMAAAAVAGAVLIMAAVLAGVALDALARVGSLRRLRDALDAMPEAMAYFDGDDRLVVWNDKYADLCARGGSTAEIGATFEAILAADMAAQAYPEAIGREEAWLAERRAVRRGDAPSMIQRLSDGRWLKVSERRATEGGVVSICMDITDLKRAEAEAEAAAAVKAEFLANMSHELRTPLTSIIGFTRLAGEQADLSDVSRNYVNRVSEASRALLATVNDILDFSKLEAGQVAIDPQPAPLADLARGVLDLFLPQAAAKDLSLALEPVDETLVIAVDPDRIRQILFNFVGNAVKFTASGGVTLRALYDAADERLRIEVIDTGAGVAPDKLDLLFKRFSQIDGSLTRAQGGTGLGLAICKGLVEAMGGEIGVDSREGEGSRFWFAIPAPRATLVDAVAAPEAEAPVSLVFEGLKLLVVDDHQTNRELARLVLAGLGVEVSEAVDGEDAVRVCGEQAFDLILMDLRMPRLDGAGALAQIRGQAGPNQSTPVLAFTADAETMEKLGALGFLDVVAKPLEPMALITAIAAAMSEPDDEALAQAV